MPRMAADAQALTSELDRAHPENEVVLDDLIRFGKAVGDRLRASILQVLHQESYSVGELCQIFAVPQPALSHHLKILHKAGLVARRREGNSIFYRRAPQAGQTFARALLADLDKTCPEVALQTRINIIHTRRNQRSAEFFTRNAAEINAHQAEICEPESYADLLLEMVQDALNEGLQTDHALEVGPGGGQLLTRLDQVFGATTGVERSTSMLGAAREALGAESSVRLRHQDFMTLPAQPRYDMLVAAMVIHHQASPASFFVHASHLLHKGGALLVAELCHHDQEWAASACGDQWLGFEPEELTNWADAAGFESVQSQYLAQKNGFRIQLHRFRFLNFSNTFISTTGTST